MKGNTLTECFLVHWEDLFVEHIEDVDILLAKKIAFMTVPLKQILFYTVFLYLLVKM